MGLQRTAVKQQREFLPAVLEVLESPPSPVGHAMVWLLLLLFAIAILWACLGEVDIVVTAPGRIVPSGQVKLVQAPEPGRIAAIRVREGEQVAAGQVLVELDSTAADADILRVRAQLDDVILQSSWRRELALWLAGDRINTTVLIEPSMGLAADEATAGALYSQQRTEISARLEALAKERDATLAQRVMARAEREKVAASLAILIERVAAHKALLDKQYGARVQYLELLQAQTELDHSLPVLAAREQQLMESAAALQARMRATLGEQRKVNLLELARLYRERSALVQELRKAGQRRRQHRITAPVTGTVLGLAVHTVGGVVATAEQLMKIVPQQPVMEVEALLRNRDVGFVSEGQSAQVKIDTFNFTKYGLLAAQVADISNDAVQDQQMGWVFRMRLQLEQDQISVGDKLVRLSPGMAITAEIKTGKRRLIEFFLSPLLRYRQESARER